MYFSSSHEWIQVENGVGTVGITDFAQKELGKIVYVELPPVGTIVRAGQEVAVLESTKAAADIYSPVSGEVLSINQQLNHFSGKINDSPEQEGWLFRIKLHNPSELTFLLEKDKYLALIR